MSWKKQNNVSPNVGLAILVAGLIVILIGLLVVWFSGESPQQRNETSPTEDLRETPDHGVVPTEEPNPTNIPELKEVFWVQCKDMNGRLALPDMEVCATDGAVVECTLMMRISQSERKSDVQSLNKFYLTLSGTDSESDILSVTVVVPGVSDQNVYLLRPGQGFSEDWEYEYEYMKETVTGEASVSILNYVGREDENFCVIFPGEKELPSKEQLMVFVQTER